MPLRYGTTAMTKAQVSDLGLSVELRGFEPLTSSLRKSPGALYRVIYP